MIMGLYKRLAVLGNGDARMKRLARPTTILLASGLLWGCTSLGLTPNLANDCAAQAAALEQGKTEMAKLMTAERASIDAQIALSQGYCQGSLPADQTAASKAVEASTTAITATLGVAALRK